MEKTTVTANVNNDLKFRQGMEDPDKKKEDLSNVPMKESGSEENGKVEYFTE